MRRQQITTLLLALLLCGVLGDHAGVATGRSAAAAERATTRRKNLDASFVHSGFAAVLIVHPQRLLSDPLAKMLPEQTNDILKTISQESRHIDVLQVEEIMFLLGPATPEGDSDIPVTPGIVMRFLQPPDQKNVAAKMLHNPTPAEFEGKKYIRGEQLTTEGIYFPDPKTMVYAPEKSLQRMMSDPQGTGPLADLIRQTSGDHDVVLECAAEPMKQWLATAAEYANSQFPQQLRPLARLPEHLKCAVLTLDLSGDILARLTMIGNDVAGSNALFSYAVVSRDFVKKAAEKAKPQMQRELPANLVGPLTHIFDDLLDGVTLKQDGLDVVLSVKAPPGWKDLPKLLAPLAEIARQRAEESKRLLALRELNMAMQERYDANGSLSPAIKSKDGKPLLSWRVELLPYLEQKDLYDQFHLDEPWDSEHNRKLIDKMPPVFGHNKEGKTCIMVFVGDGTIFGSGAFPADEADKKIMLVEAGADKAVPWTKPEDLTLDKQNPVKALGTLHDGKIRASFFDCHAEALDATMAPAKLRNMILAPSKAEAEKAK